eukprot:s49_g4.t3
MSSHLGDGLAGRVAQAFELLGDRKVLDELDRPLRQGRGQSSQQVFPLPPWSRNGKILRESAVRSQEDEIMYSGGNILLAALNWMHGGEAGASHDVGHLSSAHQRVHARMARTLQALVMTSEPTLTHGGLDQFLRQTQLYSGCGAVLPLGVRGGVPEHAADVPLADHLESLDPSMAAQVREPRLLLLSKGRRPKRVKRGYTWLSASYPELVKRNVKAGLHKYKKLSQVAKHGGVLCLAGAFAVPKDDVEDRVITDPSVNQLIDPKALPRPKFAYIPSLRSVTVPKSGLVVVSKRDARHYFHRLQIGKKWQKWLCGPPITVLGRCGGPRTVYPSSRATPMGFGPSAGWAQALTDLIARDANLPPEKRLYPDAVAPECLPVWGSIIDDVWALDHVDDDGQLPVGPIWLDRASDAWVKRGVQPHEKKSVNAVAGEEIQGYYVHPHDHWIGVSLEKRRHLFQASFDVLLRKQVVFKVMERWVGKHGFIHSARACLRSVFEETYGWLDSQRKLRPGLVELPAVVWTELLVSTLLIPYAQFDLSSPWSSRVEATDASMSGLGKAFAVMPQHIVRTLARYCSAQGTYTNLALPWGIGLDSEGKCPFFKVRLPVKMVKWKLLGTPWKPSHITVGEGDAVVWAAHGRLRRPTDDGNRFVHPIDSAAMLGALVKGRSSSKQINIRCRKVAAIHVCGGHDPFYMWVPSPENPADTPSRMFEVETSDDASDFAAQPESRHAEVYLRSLSMWPKDAVFFIHLCSGPRRTGDVIWHVEHEGALAGFNVVGVAVDPLAFSLDSLGVDDQDVVCYGDLLDPNTGRFILGLIASGRVFGGLASPPCSTISAARHLPLAGRGGPRPVRSRDSPWEPLKYCSKKEIDAVMLGSALYLTCLGLLGEIRIFGGWTGLEHPADRGDPYPSFFSTREVHLYKKHTGSVYIVTHQCMFGAVTKKPTGLLVPVDSMGLARLTLCRMHLSNTIHVTLFQILGALGFMSDGAGLNRVQRFLLNTLKPTTIEKYIAALRHLNNDLAEIGRTWHDMNEEEQDSFLAEWVLDGFEMGGSKNEYSWALSALQKIYPRLRLKTSWKVLDAWTTLSPVRQAPAAPPELLHAMVVMALILGRPQLSLAMLFAYCGLLRVREVLSLRVRDVILGPSTLVLCLGRTKRGMEQKVVLTNPSVIQWFANYVTRFPLQEPDSLLFKLSYSSMLRWVKRLALLLGAECLHLTTHTFRRSGASELSRQGMALSDILLYGRWLSERAARDYIRKGEVAMWRAKGLLAESDWSRILTWGKLAMFAWPVFDGALAVNVRSQHMHAVVALDAPCVLLPDLRHKIHQIRSGTELAWVKGPTAICFS